MENVFTTFFDLSKKGQENSVNCVNCVKLLNYQTLPSKNETEEREGYYESTARPVGKSRITSTRPGLNQYKTPITKMLQRVAMIFAVLMMSIANIGMAWGYSYMENHATPSAESGDLTQITVVSNVSFGNNSLQINSNGASGSFTIAILDGSYIDSITFAKNGNYPVGSLEPHTGTSGTVTNRNSGEIWKFVPSSSISSATFDMSAPSSQKTRLNNIKIYWQSNYEHFTKNFSVTGSSNPYTINCTKSNASSDVTMTINSNSSLISSNCLQLGNGKIFTITSAGHNIKKIIFLATSNGAISNLSANTGTYTSSTKTWVAGSGTQTVTFTSSGSNATIAAISIELEEIGTSHSVTAATEDEDKGTAAAASTSVVEGATTTITATPKSGYAFDHWTVSGTGATLSSTSTNPTTLTMGTANATVTAYFVEKTCPSSGTLYTAAVKSSVSSNQSFPASATTEVSPTTQADITGGQLFAINGESSAKNLIANSSGYKFCMTNNSTKFKLVLECELQVGDIITIDGVGGTKDDAPIGLWVSSSDSRPGSVTSSDEYHGKSILYIHRAVGTSTYFNNINISRSAVPSCTAPSSVSIGDQWLAFVGEPLTLTASLTGGSGDHTYQWYKGGTSDGYAIEGATSATYYKAEAEAGDADNYYCKVSTEGDDDVWSEAYKVQVLRLQLM